MITVPVPQIREWLAPAFQLLEHFCELQRPALDRADIGLHITDYEWQLRWLHKEDQIARAVSVGLSWDAWGDDRLELVVYAGMHYPKTGDGIARDSPIARFSLSLLTDEDLGALSAAIESAFALVSNWTMDDFHPAVLDRVRAVVNGLEY